MRMKMTAVLMTSFLCAVSSVFAGVLPQVVTYEQLLHAIRETRTASQQRIETLVDQEKIREAWETGKLIDTHVLQHKERADYDKQVLTRLSVDLETSQRELYYMLRFARLYPILTAPSKLSWSHYRELVSVEDPIQRKGLEEKAVQQHWGHKRIRKEVSRIKQREKTSPEELVAKPGKIGTYRIVKIEAGPDKGSLTIDLGFSNYYQLGEMKKFKEGDMVEASPLKTPEPGLVSYNFFKSDKISVGNGPARDVKIPAGRTQTTGDEYLFTYKAYVTQVIDGDTFDALVELGFGITTKQKLRLRGLDAPEIESSEGREAKTFLEKRFAAAGGTVLIKTVKSDKYDRYLADVFLPQSDKEENYSYLNQELIKQGLAVRMND